MEVIGLAEEDNAIKIIAIQGGLFHDPIKGDKAGFLVAYEGKAPDSVVKLRTASRKLGYFTKTYFRGFPVTQNEVGKPKTYTKYNYLQIAATKLDLLAKEIGDVVIERFDEMCKDAKAR